MAEYPLMKYWEAPDGTVYEVCDEEARNKGIDEEQLADAVNMALEQAKESGEFDGAPGKDGKDGTAGKDGVSPSVTVSKSGKVTTIKITDAAGTKTATVNDGADGAAGKDGYTPQKGVDYFDGAPGAAGKDGTSVTVASVSESTADGGTNTVTFSDGKNLNIKNGSKGSKGDPGSDATVTEASIKSALGYTPADAETVSQLSAEKENKLDVEAYGLPILKLTGDVSAMTKDNAVDLAYEYGDLSGTASVKWQGSSSIAWPKKNYTIKFDQAFEAAEGWGVQKKYCLKANFIDFSHARNVVSAKLWGQIVKSRSTVPAKLSGLPNGGAVDGFPICVTINGVYQGLYTWNIPKDGWMLGMGSGDAECIMGANHHSDATKFEATALCDETDFEIEYVPDENNVQWAINSLNTLISAVMESDGSDVDSVVAQHVDLDSAIDFYIFVTLISGTDNYDKNYLLSTFDGVKWFFTMYDMDSTYGLEWDGKGYTAPDVTYPTLVNFRHNLVTLLKKYKTDKVKARYAELRNGVLSESNVLNTFLNFITKVPARLFEEETKLWPTLPSTSTNNISQIADNFRIRVKMLDAQIDTLEPEEPADPIAPSVLAVQNTWYKGSTPRSDITEINVVTSYSETGNESESWNADANNSGAIKCFVTGTALTIASMTGARRIQLPYNATGIFGGNSGDYFANVTQIKGTDRFVADPAGTVMTNACRNMAKLTSPISIPEGVTNLNSAFMGCSALNEPPVIPERANDLRYFLSGCTSLTELPDIPSGYVGVLTSVFYDCSKVGFVNVAIPAGATTLDYAFYNMRKAYGKVEINAANLTNYAGAFSNACTDSSSTGIVLSGSNSNLAQIAATNAQGKVTVG